MTEQPKSFPDQVLAWYDNGGKWLALIGLGALLAYLARDFWRSCVLLRRMRRGRPRGGIHDVIGSVVVIAVYILNPFKFVENLKDIAEGRGSIFRRTRMLVEHEMFAADEDGVNFGQAFFVYGNRYFRFQDGDQGVQDRDRTWCLPNIYRPANQMIHVENAAEVNKRFKAISDYFSVLSELLGKDKRRREVRDVDNFLCAILIENGFVSPIHLITGLIAQYDESWKRILDLFNEDADRPISAFDDLATDTRQIQMFVYTCWLLWGPSVPLCSCENSVGLFRVVQYGYGDENNSIDVVGATEDVDTAMNQLHKAASDRQPCRMDGSADAGLPMALPAMVLGRLRLSDSIKRDRQGHDIVFPKGVVQNWQSDPGLRPVLHLTRLETGDAVNQGISHDSSRMGRLMASNRTVASKYYSAYLWIAFVMMEVGDDGVLRPLGEKGRPWADFIPFFEHGNLADPQSCAYSKSQLAAKVTDAFQQLAKAATGKPVRFVFACSIDEPGCDSPPAFPGWQGRRLIRDILRERLKKAGLDRGRNKGLIVLDPAPAEWRAAKAYHACRISRLVERHYDSFPDEPDTPDQPDFPI